MQTWPRLCVRCGEDNPTKLHPQHFHWRAIISSTESPGYVSTEEAHMDVTSYMCRPCFNIGVLRWWIATPIAFVLMMVGFAWTFGAFGSVDLLGLALLIPSLIVFIKNILLRRQVSRFYMHFYPSGQTIQGFFRSKTYKKAFYYQFPGGIRITHTTRTSTYK